MSLRESTPQDRSPSVTYAGTIISTEDFQVKDGGELMFYASGKPVMGVRITLASESGLQILLAESPHRLAAIAKAVKSAGAKDVELGGYLAVYPVPESEGHYGAAYAPPGAAYAPPGAA
jgi:hypothetical protein